MHHEGETKKFDQKMTAKCGSIWIGIWSLKVEENEQIASRLLKQSKPRECFTSI